MLCGAARQSRRGEGTYDTGGDCALDAERDRRRVVETTVDKVVGLLGDAGVRHC